MNGNEFLDAARPTLDWVAHYMDHADRYPVQSPLDPGAIRAALPDSPPETGEPWEAIWEDFEQIILPGVTHWQSPNFFAYFPANGSGPGILGELLSATLGVNGMLWATCPAATELETHVLDWLVQMLGLPDHFRGRGVIQDSASSSSLLAMLCARERATNERGVEEGLSASPAPLTVYTSSEAHSSILKAAAILGFGRRHVRFVETDDSYAMCPLALEEAITTDIEAGLLPTLVSATCGTTSSMAFDPLPSIAEVAQRHGLWLHVDAAMAGTSLVCPEHRDWAEGLDRADSFTFNPHKWMLTNFDCNAFYVRDTELLNRVLSVTPEYLKTGPEETIEYRDWQIPLGRRFRALKLWFVIRHHGAEGIRTLVRRHVELAGWFAEQIRQDPRFELAAPPALALVCFRLKGTEEANRALLDHLNASGRLLLSHTKLEDRLVLRFSIGQSQTDREHVEAAWDRIDRTTREILGAE